MVEQPAKLSEAEVARRLQGLPGWSLADGKLFREFAFRDFRAAFAFMTRVAQEAEAAGHHPDWCNAYGKVRVHLTTHAVGGLTERDFALAARMDSLAGE